MAAHAFAQTHFADDVLPERPLPSGALFHLDRPAATPLKIDDLAAILAFESADRSPLGFYSLAQRAVHLAHLAAARGGDRAGCHALILFAPLVLIRWAQGQIDARRVVKIEEAIARSFGLDWPASGRVERALSDAAPQLRASEMVWLHRRPARSALRITPWAPENARTRFIGTWRTYAHMAQLAGHA